MKKSINISFFLLILMTSLYLFDSNLAFIIFILNIYIYKLSLPKYYRYCEIESIFAGIIISLPVSFINIFGGNYSDIPISWFNIFIIIGILYIIWNLFIYKKIKISLFSMFLFMFIFMNIIAIIRNIEDISSFFTIVTPIFFIFLLSMYENLNINYKNLIELYLNVIIATCISLIIQVMIYKLFNIKLGYINIYNNRVAFGYLFSDFSFLSLFIASGASICVYNFIQSKKIVYLILSIFISFCSIITSARTGVVSLIIVFMLASIIEIGINIRKILVYIMFLPIVYFLFNIALSFIIKLRGGQSLFDASGRLETYYTSFLVFKENIMLGIGIGIDSYRKYVLQNISDGNITIPHNFIIQSLVQFGLIGFVVIVIIMFLVVKTSFKFKDKRVFYSFLTIFIGSLFIPDILNSRFFPLQIALIILQYKSIRFNKYS